MVFAYARRRVLTTRHDSHRRCTVEVELKSQDRNVALDLRLAQWLSQKEALKVS